MSRKNVDPKEVFGRNPDNYDNNRLPYSPEYTQEVFEYICRDAERASGKKWPDRPNVADVGAGTGKLGDIFLKLGCRVTFVEPNPQLIQFLQGHFGHNPEAAIVAASAEKTGLPAGSVDLIVIGDAAHWLEPNALPELRRILKPEGRIALFARFWSQESPLTRKVHDLLLKECKEYRHSPTQLLRDIDNLKKRLGRHLVHEEENAWHGYVFLQTYSQDELVNFFRSCSFSSNSIANNETSFRRNVIGPLWDFAASQGVLTADGKIRVPYEVNALYGPPSKRVILERDGDLARYGR